MEPVEYKNAEPFVEEKYKSTLEESDVEEESDSTESKGDTYQLARDRKNRAIKPPKRYAAADLIVYALSAAHEINDDELRIYQEAITSKNRMS